MERADSNFFKPKRLRLLRFYYDITCQELADKTGLSKQAISKFENGKLNPSEVTILGLCSYFKLPKDFFTATSISFKCNGNRIVLTNPSNK